MTNPKPKPTRDPAPATDPRPSPDPGPVPGGGRDGRSGRADDPVQPPENPAKEIGGRKGPEPTRYGDWEVRGIASDF